MSHFFTCRISPGVLLGTGLFLLLGSHPLLTAHAADTVVRQIGRAHV